LLDKKEREVPDYTKVNLFSNRNMNSAILYRHMPGTRVYSKFAVKILKTSI